MSDNAKHLIKRIRDLFYDMGADDGVMLADNLAEDLGILTAIEVSPTDESEDHH